MFRVGQKVVCVDAKATHTANVSEITEGSIYTIRAMRRDDVWLGEITQRPVLQGGKVTRWIDYPFKASRFRPLVTRKTDIGFAHEILRKVTKKKTAPIKTFENSSWFGG
jgi:hypothetical protein